VESEAELAKSQEAQQALSRSVEDREREIGRLTKEMDQIRSERDRISAKLSDLQSERDTVQRQVAELEKAKGELESKVMELSGGQPLVELEKVRVSGESLPSAAGTVVPASTALGPSQGQVVVINREYDFIVMNLGKNQGLTVGQEFDVVRGEEILGRVKVEKVYDELSAAAILPDSRKDQIREGDTVKSI
jgi:predicted RNase H-like nuclease (RuvC/YqgF family)